MHELATRVLNTTRKKWFRVCPLFEAHKPITASEVERIEAKVGASLPEDLKAWLLAVGYGDVDETLSFRYEWFFAVEQGHLRGVVSFAQDDLGNFYAYSPTDGRIVFFNRSEPEYAVISPSFRAFMEELERRDFHLGEWMNSQSCAPYRWDASQETPDN